MTFDSLADGGRALAAALEPDFAGRADALVMPILPNGVPAALEIAAGLGLGIVALAAERDADGLRIPAPGDLAGRCAIVVDDGVETGTAARAAVDAVRRAGAAEVVLAVPVCPREAEAALALAYDRVVAVERPLARRALTWHYRDFDTITADEALRRLREAGYPVG